MLKVLRKVFAGERKKRFLDEIKQERELSLIAMEQKRLEALREINQELKLLAEDRNKYLTEMVALVQTEASMVREITGKTFLEGLDKMKAVLNIEQASIDNLNASNPNASSNVNRNSNTDSKKEP